MKRFFLSFVAVVFLAPALAATAAGEALKPAHELTGKLITLVDQAVDLVTQEGEAAFDAFDKPGSKWAHGETYIYVLDPAGNCRVHPDPQLAGKNLLDATDINGKRIFLAIRRKASGPQNSGWVHYQWPKPGMLFPTWKSVYVRRATAPSGSDYFVCCGLYNMQMEKMFAVEVVETAAELLKQRGREPFSAFRSKAGDFYFLDVYVFVLDQKGTDLVNPAFPNLEGRNIYDLKDENGKLLTREMLKVVDAQGAGWVDYLWARPGSDRPVKKTAYVKGVDLGGERFIVGSGIFSE